MDPLQYPIGRFEFPAEMNENFRKQWIEQIAALPDNLRNAVQRLTEQQLQTPYREGGWTVKQVVHHVADSHVNAYTRFKLAITEDVPTIKPYDEKQWATLEDSNVDIESSLRLLEGLHQRWTALLYSLTLDQFARTFFHPENGMQTLESILGMYAWHGNHHVAHITSLAKRMGW